MKEYWVNVYTDPTYDSCKWPSVLHAKIAATGSRQVFGIRTKYRIHVKIKDKPGLSRPYFIDFKDWEFMNGSQWTPEQIERMGRK